MICLCPKIHLKILTYIDGRGMKVNGKDSDLKYNKPTWKWGQTKLLKRCGSGAHRVGMLVVAV